MSTWFTRLFTRASTKKGQKPIYPGGLACQEVVELVTDYLEGALLAEKQKQFEEHIANCDGCAEYLEQVRLTIGMLHTLAKEPAFPETREDLLNVFRQWKNDQQIP